MNNTDTLVSIVLPVQNAGAHLAGCLESLRAQTHKNLEVIAIDDKSTDDSLEILKSFAKKDKRVRVFANKKRYGMAICFNRGVKKARGKFITFMSAQSKSVPEKLQSQVTYLEQNPKTVAVGTQAIVFKKHGKTKKVALPQDHDNIYQLLLTGAMRFETVLINRYLLPKDLLHFRHNLFPMLYTDVFIKMIRYGYLANLPMFLHFHFSTAKKLGKASTKVTKTTSHVKLWLKSVTLSQYRPSIRSLITPLRNA